MGEMKRAEAREHEQRIQERYGPTLVIAASIMAAVRLARETDLNSKSPRVVGAISDSIRLARWILDRVMS